MPDAVKEQSLDRVIQIVRDAFYSQMSRPAVAVEGEFWVREVFEDHVIVQGGDGLYLYPYTFDDENRIAFGSPERVEIEYVPAKAVTLADDGLVAFGDTIKAVSENGTMLKVGAYGIRFGSEDETDLQGEWFAPDTDYGPYNGDGMPTMVHHGIPLKSQIAELADRTLGLAKATKDDVGIFVETVLDLADMYQSAIAKLVKAGKLKWSSGTAPQLAKKDATGKLTRWHPVEWSFTPTPAEFRLPAVMPVKAYRELPFDGPETEPEGGAGQVPSAAVVAPTATGSQKMAQKTPTSREEPNMPPEVQQQTVTIPIDLEAVISAAVTKSIEAVDAKWEERLKQLREEAARNAPPINAGKAGVVVTQDEADRALEGNPFKHAGEFYLAVADACRPGGIVDQRLLPLRGGKEVENGFNVAKALGRDYVGGLYNASLRIKGASGISGLGERVPSDGGFLVSQQRGGLLERAYAVGDMLQRVDMLPIGPGANGITLYAEDETSRADGSRRGGIRAYWAAEGASVTASKPKFREMNMKLHKLMAVVYCTDELVADATALEAYILRNLPEELRFVTEDSIFNGSGSGQPSGLLTSGALITVEKEPGQGAATIVSENIVKMWARLWSRSRRDAFWAIDQTIEPQLHLMSIAVGTGGSPVYMPPGGLSASPFATLMGRPVIPHEYGAVLGTVGDILLVDLGQFQMIEKGEIEQASSMHVLFLYDEMAFRFVYRVEGQSKWNAPLTPKSGGDTQSPFIALATRA